MEPAAGGHEGRRPAGDAGGLPGQRDGCGGGGGPHPAAAGARAARGRGQALGVRGEAARPDGAAAGPCERAPAAAHGRRAGREERGDGAAGELQVRPLGERGQEPPPQDDRDARAGGGGGAAQVASPRLDRDSLHPPLLRRPLRGCAGAGHGAGRRVRRGPARAAPPEQGGQGLDPSHHLRALEQRAEAALPHPPRRRGPRGAHPGYADPAAAHGADLPAAGARDPA
mmetsp:Transcript_43841/g.139708  ORF Transcript_43841/g.139708 Transcript_43841/m.139708 type:complete len:227 (-) Transcript_43841:996-1676(-)